MAVMAEPSTQDLAAEIEALERDNARLALEKAELERLMPLEMRAARAIERWLKRKFGINWGA